MPSAADCRLALPMKAISHIQEIRIDARIKRVSRIGIRGVVEAVTDCDRTRRTGENLQSRSPTESEIGGCGVGNRDISSEMQQSGVNSRNRLDAPATPKVELKSNWRKSDSVRSSTANRAAVYSRSLAFGSDRLGVLNRFCPVQRRLRYESNWNYIDCELPGEAISSENHSSPARARHEKATSLALSNPRK